MLHRETDPLVFIPYLKKQAQLLCDTAVRGTADLLPMDGYVADDTCTYVKQGRRHAVTRHHRLDPAHRYWLLEKEVTIPRGSAHLLPVLHVEWGPQTQGVVFINGGYAGALGTAVWAVVSELPLFRLKSGRCRIGLHAERFVGFGGKVAGHDIVMDRAEIRFTDTRLTDLAMAFQTAAGAWETMHEHDPQRYALYRNLRSAFALLDLRSYERMAATAPAVTACLEKHVYNGRNPLDVTVTVFGHGHLDIGWMWRFDDSRKKILRTMLQQLALLDHYPDAVFQCSQAPLFMMLKEHYPAVYARVKKAVRAGRIEASGGMWVEADTNVTGLESLVRQLAYGKRYYRDEFGTDCRVVWLPDVFGFTRALPQLLKKSGFDVMLTTKISWNRHTRFPYDTFEWQGIDGTSVPVHYVSTVDALKPGKACTYNTTAASGQVAGTWQAYLQKDVNHELAMPYGHGDGGCGPEYRMYDRVQWLAKGIRGFCRVRHGGLEDYWRRLKKVLGRRTLPVWTDELYLEMHRGTYTTQAELKLNNRHTEAALKAAEAVCVLSGTGPGNPMTAVWERFLIVHFHDVLPGSSIREVYDDCRELLKDIRHDACSLVDPFFEEHTEPAPANAAVFNASPGRSRARVRAGKGWVSTGDMGGMEVATVALPAARTTVLPEPVLDNGLVRVRIDTDSGAVTGITDLSVGREVLAGYANVLRLFEDRPMVYDAWELERYHEEKPVHTGITVTKKRWYRRGAAQVCRLEGTLHNSTVTQELVLMDGDPVLYVDTDIDWQEEHLVLRATADAAVLVDAATYGIQGGTVQRPTHRNTLADQARFEVPAQCWMDLSEGDYGLTLLTDSKYGFSALGNRMGVTLLRAPANPDPRADRGRHRFTHAYYAHAGDWRAADVPLVSKGITDPPYVYEGRAGTVAPAVEIRDDAGNVHSSFMADVLKPAEDGRGVVLRGYEGKGTRGTVVLRLDGMKVASASVCNLLEEPVKQLKVRKDGSVRIAYGPYEVVTVRLLV